MPSRRSSCNSRAVAAGSLTLREACVDGALHWSWGVPHVVHTSTASHAIHSTSERHCFAPCCCSTLSMSSSKRVLLAPSLAVSWPVTAVPLRSSHHRSFSSALCGCNRHDIVAVWRHCEVPRLKQHRKASGNPPHRVCDAPWLHHAAKPPHLSCAVDRLRFVAGTAAQLQRHSDCGNASVRTVPRLAAQCQTTQAMLTERFCKCQGLC